MAKRLDRQAMQSSRAGPRQIRTCQLAHTMNTDEREDTSVVDKCSVLVFGRFVAAHGAAVTFIRCACPTLHLQLRS
jgi:hypothetical protein